MGIEGEIVGTGLASLTLTQIQQWKANGEVVDGMEFPGLRLQPILGLYALLQFCGRVSGENFWQFSEAFANPSCPDRFGGFHRQGSSCKN